MWFTAWISPSLIEISSAVPPAFSTAFRGSVNSTSSTPSVARNAIFLPRIDLLMSQHLHWFRARSHPQQTSAPALQRYSGHSALLRSTAAVGDPPMGDPDDGFDDFWQAVADD